MVSGRKVIFLLFRERGEAQRYKEEKMSLRYLRIFFDSTFLHFKYISLVKPFPTLRFSLDPHSMKHSRI